jgi:hypothetical protein
VAHAYGGRPEDEHFSQTVIGEGGEGNETGKDYDNRRKREHWNFFPK